MEIFMSEIRAELKYSASHEWIRLEADGSVLIGITDYAQQALGDIVFVELPDKGEYLDLGAEIAIVESVKAASDIYAPISGEVLELNEDLSAEPSLINDSPYDLGWLLRLRPKDLESLKDLMDEHQYEDYFKDD
jgi:glycine cleavage system H protein|tara:strand:- start:142836 stop:143237 length:402 start_codon:yes stop_codon:yes gene_type:complete